VYPTWSTAAWTLVRTGHDAEAASLVDELLARRRANPRGVMPGYWILVLSLTLERLGRPGELAALDEPRGSRFLEAALGIDSGRYLDAAETLREMGVPQFEAEARLLAARELRAAADETAADAQLERARELLRGLEATARLRELDGSTAATNRSA
jgi:hypothetical protein